MRGRERRHWRQLGRHEAPNPVRAGAGAAGDRAAHDRHVWPAGVSAMSVRVAPTGRRPHTPTAGEGAAAGEGAVVVRAVHQLAADAA